MKSSFPVPLINTKETIEIDGVSLSFGKTSEITSSSHPFANWKTEIGDTPDVDKFMSRYGDRKKIIPWPGYKRGDSLSKITAFFVPVTPPL